MADEPIGVLHVLDHSVPLHSGYAFRSQEIFRAQANRGWRVAAVTSSRHERDWTGEGKERENLGGIWYYRTGWRSRRLPTAVDEMVEMVRLARRIDDVAAIERPAILHAHSPILNALPALWVGWRRRIPVVYEVRAFWEDAAVDHGSYRVGSAKYRFVKAAETLVCRRVRHVVTICEGLRTDLIRRGIPGDKVSIVPNGVRTELFSTCPPDAAYRDAWNLRGKTVIGYIGSFYRYEGLDLLLDGFGDLARRRADVALLLVGGGEMEVELRAQIARLGLDGRVVIPGRVAHDRVPGVYALVDVLVYPRTSQRLTELVTPLKPLEAMAMGKAVVASDIGGHRELIVPGTTGVLFPPDDRAGLAKAVERVLDDTELRWSLERRGAEWVRRTRSWERTTEGYTAIYGNAAGGRMAGAR